MTAIQEARAGGAAGRLTIAAALLVFCARVVFSQAQNGPQPYEVVAAFHGFGGEPKGRLLQSNDGALYGTAQTGGALGLGSIFALRQGVSGQVVFEELHSFWGGDGAYPAGGLVVGPGGFLYGLTVGGGKYGHGTVYKLAPLGFVTVVYDFPGFPAASDPAGELLAAADGNLYGVSGGGRFDDGLVFQVDRNDRFTVIAEFEFLNGATPNAPLVEGSDGAFYGTTLIGYPPGGGFGSTIFRVTLGGTITSLHHFAVEEGDLVSTGLTRGQDGKLYGVAVAGGTGNGTIFRTSTDGDFAKLHDFDPAEEEGSSPLGTLLLASDGNLYGTTDLGGASGAGTLFRLATGGFEKLWSFPAQSGGTKSGLIQQVDGRLVGSAAGRSSLGMVFAADVGFGIDVLHDFVIDTGLTPRAGLAEGADGNLYGSTYAGGGLNASGTLFRMSLTGDLTFLHRFQPSDGAAVESPLVAVGDLLFGTAPSGGTTNGTAFSLGLDARFDLLHAFTHAEGDFPGPVIHAPDGFLYGVAARGGANDFGTFFRMSANGSVTVAHDFDGTHGDDPTSLLQASDGNLYGLTHVGGDANLGTAFRVTLPALDFTPLHDFQYDEGGQLSGPLAEKSGYLYGTAQLAGGESSSGTVFKMSFAGDVSVLHAFPSGGAEGGGPRGGVLAADDDLLYGTTIDGGAFGHGTVFRLTTAGDFEVVRHLDGQVEGRRPFGSVLQASDRNLYGTAAEGGAGGMGVVFRVLLSPHSPEIDSVEPSSGSSAGGASVRISGSHFQTMPQVEIGGNAVTLRDIDHRTVAAIAPAGTPGTAADVSLTNPDGTTDTLSAGWFFDFLDVSALHQFHHAVVAVTRNGISRGCGAGSFCPSVLMTRAQLAVMLLRGAHGADFSPPPATGTVFNDVPAGAFAASWIEELADEGISKGCGSGKFCPDAVVSRAAVAPLMLRAKHGPNYKPPPATGTVYTDVPAGSPFADWIEQFAAEGITSGCGSESFCPNAKLSRGEVSVFIARAFGLN